MSLGQGQERNLKPPLDQDTLIATSADGQRQRRCVASGDVLPEPRLIRFVVAPDGALTPDLAADLVVLGSKAGQIASRRNIQFTR